MASISCRGKGGGPGLDQKITVRTLERLDRVMEKPTASLARVPESRLRNHLMHATRQTAKNQVTP
jgi:hypothetical protein